MPSFFDILSTGDRLFHVLARVHTTHVLVLIGTIHTLKVHIMVNLLSLTFATVVVLNSFRCCRLVALRSFPVEPSNEGDATLCPKRCPTIPPELVLILYSSHEYLYRRYQLRPKCLDTCEQRFQAAPLVARSAKIVCLLREALRRLRRAEKCEALVEIAVLAV